MTQLRRTGVVRSSLMPLTALCVLALFTSACDDDEPTGPSGPPGRRIFGVDASNNLIRFGAMRPDQATSRAITGLPSGESIVGIDFRPADNRLYALGRTSRIYTVDTTSAAAMQVGSGTFAPALSGASFGFDFNPVPDRIRTHGDTEQNLRLHPVTGAVAATDGMLAYMTGDPGAGSNPSVVGTAYTNSVAGATTTTLYAVDAARDALVTLPDPNSGQMRTVGALGASTTDVVGFDIAGNDASAYATLTLGATGASRLYTINLTTGAATAVGDVGGNARLLSIAIAP